MKRTAASLLIIIVSVLTAEAQQTRGFSPADLPALREVADVRLSPDGGRAVFTVSETSSDGAGRISRLWTVSTAGGEPKRLTTGDFSESAPRYSPDGRRIAFYSNRDGRQGIWVVPADGGEPKLATRVYQTNFYLKSAGESFAWAPDSRRIAFLSSIEVLSDRPAQAASPQIAGLPPQVLRPLTREEIDKLPVEVREMIYRAQGQALGRRPASANESLLSAIPDDPRVITRLQYKSGTGFSDSLQSHIFVIDLESGSLRQVTTGPFYEHSIDWSPKGGEIVFVSNRQPDPDKVNNTDLFTVNVETFAIRRLTNTPGCEWQPAWSPDGTAIAYLATIRQITTIDSVAEDTQAYMLPAAGGQPVEVSRGLDRRVSSLAWSRDGGRLHFLIADQGKTVLVAADSDGRSQSIQRLIDRPIQIAAFSAGPDRTAAVIYSDPTRPAEVYFGGFAAGGSTDGLKRITAFNANLIGNVRVFEPKEFRFSNDGFEIQGWVYLPPGDRLPAILSIHGGPHGMHGYGFNPTVQALTAAGYGVILINPRGSSGYGQKFSDGCLNDWGGSDYRDLMKGVDEALAKFPSLDGDRLGVTGGSYGGYMTNWIVTQTTRFKAAVSIASLSNLISFYSTSLYQDLIHAEFNGYPWDSYEILWERSPVRHIKNAATPTLLIHGEQDNDVHITQAEEMYTALRMRGIETVFIRYPREGHGIRELRHRQDMLARTILWFDRNLKSVESRK